MSDITNPKLLYAKGGLFVFTGAVASALLLVEQPTVQTALLLAVAVWCFARAYYFAFYVIEHYIDPGYRFAGLWDFAQYALARRRGNVGRQGTSHMPTTESMADRYRRWFEYEQAAHRLVLASLQTVPAERRAEPAFQKAVNVFAHILAARRMWLYRFGILGEAPAELFPQAVAAESLAAQADAVHAAWAAYLERLDDAELARDFEYRAVDGKRFRSRIEDILTQLFGHSCYHRGQIATQVKLAGGEPAVTDFVYWSRTPLGD